MFRKVTLAIATVATIDAAALVPTSAGGGGWKGGKNWGWGYNKWA
jgi:hypothetical protein